jgi:hypothetical protein
VSLADKVADMMALRKPRALDETKNAEARERGAKAEALLRDEALQLAFRQLDEAYTTFWRNTSPEDVDTRERAWASLKVLDDVRNLLISTVQNGAAAQQELERALRR